VPSGFVPVVLMPGVSFQSRLAGVAHDASDAASSKFSMRPCALRSSAFSGVDCKPPRFSGRAFGVGQLASSAASVSVVPG
jgi:hypothetical protein